MLKTYSLQAELAECKKVQAASAQEHAAQEHAAERMHAAEQRCQQLEALCEQRAREAGEAKREALEASRRCEEALAEAARDAASRAEGTLLNRLTISSFWGSPRLPDVPSTKKRELRPYMMQTGYLELERINGHCKQKLPHCTARFALL
jgi:hypothetical protein